MNAEALFAIGVLVIVLSLPLFGIGWLIARWLRTKPAATAKLEAMITRPAKGYFKLVEIRGVPLLVHWSLPAGGFLISAYAGFNLREAAYYCVGYLLLVGLHELGHVAAARFHGLKVFAVEISGVGGLCKFEPPKGLRDTFLVYAAGLLAQLALLALTLSYLTVFGRPTTLFGSCLVQTFTLVNLVVVLANVVPAGKPPGIATDGYVLWQLFLHVWRKYPMVGFAGPPTVFPPDTCLLSLEGLVPGNFVVGLEILNDNKTPMEFVVRVLMTHLDLERNKAIELMLAIHRKGGLLVPLPTMEKAEDVAAGVALDVREHGYSFVCRVVDARQQV